jgi:hypothetical protein
MTKLTVPNNVKFQSSCLHRQANANSIQNFLISITTFSFGISSFGFVLAFGLYYLAFK